MKTLTQAFFSAADSIAEPQRAAVVKAALAAIRDQLKDDRDKTKAAKAKAKMKAGRAPVGRPKAAAHAAKKAAAPPPPPPPAPKKAPVKRRAKAAAAPMEDDSADADTM
jgi:hypothetical protein